MATPGGGSLGGAPPPAIWRPRPTRNPRFMLPGRAVEVDLDAASLTLSVS